MKLWKEILLIKNFFPKDEIITISESMKLPKNTMLILKENQKIIIKNGSILVLFVT